MKIKKDCIHYGFSEYGKGCVLHCGLISCGDCGDYMHSPGIMKLHEIIQEMHETNERLTIENRMLLEQLNGEG